MTLALYFSRMLGTRILLSWSVLLLVALGIDLLRTASDLIERGGVSMVAEYAWLRLPLLGTVLLPISALTGAIIAFLTLSARSELTVIRAAGQSIWRILAILGPLALMLGVFHHLLGDRFSTWAQEGLSEMFPLEVETSLDTSEGRAVWSRDGEEIFRAFPAAEDGSVLTDVTIFRLDANGHLVERLSAASATYRGDRWELTSAASTVDGGTVHFDTREWKGRTTPADIFSLAEGQRIVGLSQARAVLAGDAVPIRGQAYYETRVARSYVAYAVPGIMIILAALSAFGSTRHGGSVKLAVLAVVLGFLYIAIDGFVASLGEVGAVAPLIAAGAPSGLFLLTAVWCVLVQES